MANLDITHNGFKTIPDILFDPLVNLKQLKIGFNPIENLTPRLFKELTHLKTLDLSSLQLITLDTGIIGDKM